MTDVLIRNVPDVDMERIRAQAAEEHSSLQAYLTRLLQAHGDYLRRKDALAATRRRLAGLSAISSEDRAAVFAAMDDASEDRAGRLASGGQRDH